MIVFCGAPGRVLAFRDPAMPANIKPLTRLNPDLGFVGQRSIISQIGVTQQSNFQFLHTLGGSIYVYVFGDRIGQVEVGGLSFGPECTSGSLDPCFSTPNTEYGVERMFGWYNQNKLSARATPIQIQIGRSTVRAFVAGMTTNIVDPLTWLAQYRLSLMVLPERPKRGQ